MTTIRTAVRSTISVAAGVFGLPAIAAHTLRSLHVSAAFAIASLRPAFPWLAALITSLRAVFFTR